MLHKVFRQNQHFRHKSLCVTKHSKNEKITFKAKKAFKAKDVAKHLFYVYLPMDGPKDGKKH